MFLYAYKFVQEIIWACFSHVIVTEKHIVKMNSTNMYDSTKIDCSINQICTNTTTCMCIWYKYVCTIQGMYKFVWYQVPDTIFGYRSTNNLITRLNYGTVLGVNAPGAMYNQKLYHACLLYWVIQEHVQRQIIMRWFSQIANLSSLKGIHIQLPGTIQKRQSHFHLKMSYQKSNVLSITSNITYWKS